MVAEVMGGGRDGEHRLGSRTRLLFFYFGTGSFRYGVAEVFRLVLNRIDKTRYEPYLVITGTLSEPVHGLSDSVEVVQLNCHGLRKALFPFSRVLREIRPDILISAMEHPNALAVVSRMLSRHRCKLVLTSHNVLTPRLKHMWNGRYGWMTHRALQWTYPYADHLVCVSNAVRDDLRGYVTSLPPSSVIYNPVLHSNGFFDPTAEKQKGLIVTSCRLEGYKKVDEVIRALQFLEERFHLLVLGDGPERARLGALVMELGLSDRIEFKGYVNNPFAYYQEAEVFVLPSMWEGFGNVLIESMACGCQVVANAAAWAPVEILGQGEYGFLYEGGRPDDLARAIREAVACPKPVSKLVKYARQFTDERAAREYERLFESLSQIEDERAF